MLAMARSDACREMHATIIFPSAGLKKLTIRCFSANPPNDAEKKSTESTSTKDRILASILTPKNQFYALVAGGSLGAYAFSRMVLGFTNFFTHLNHSIVAKWGFYTGFGSATFLGLVGLVTVDNIYIRADPVYRYCRDWVVKDPSVQAALGDSITPGSLRSYRLDSGKFEMEGSAPVWKPPRIQMLFDVTAHSPPYRTGLVTCEAIKSGGFPPKLQTTLLKVDYETGNEGEGGTQEDDETLFLVGSQEDLERVSKRSGLSLEMLARQVHINKAAAGRK